MRDIYQDRQNPGSQLDVFLNVQHPIENYLEHRGEWRDFKMLGGEVTITRLSSVSDIGYQSFEITCRLRENIRTKVVTLQIDMNGLVDAFNILAEQLYQIVLQFNEIQQQITDELGQIYDDMNKRANNSSLADFNHVIYQLSSSYETSEFGRAAMTKSLKLLYDFLTDDQKKDLETKGHFIVTGGKTGMKYGIGLTRSGNVQREDGKNLCLVATERVPIFDQILMQKFMIEMREAEFMQGAHVMLIPHFQNPPFDPSFRSLG